MAEFGDIEGLTRRSLLASTALAFLVVPFAKASARSFGGALPWLPESADPPAPAVPGAWHFFTPAEGAAIEAIVDRLIPHDDLSPGGTEMGCAVFIDRQLAGPYGDARGLYMRPPFAKASPLLGPQSQDGPAAQYRLGLAALDAYTRKTFSNKGFRELAADQQDEVLKGLEAGKIELASDISSAAFFKLLLQNTKEGFFADPIYGGNRDMKAWVMIGFPGARYDYRDHVDKHNIPYPLPPVSIMGRPAWNGKS